MPRAKTQIETTGLAGDPRCRRQIREVLAYGRSVLGGPREYGLATRDDWGDAWEKYGDDLAARTFKQRTVAELRDRGFDLRLAFEDDPRNVHMFHTQGVPCVYIHSGYYE